MPCLSSIEETEAPSLPLIPLPVFSSETCPSDLIPSLVLDIYNDILVLRVTVTSYAPAAVDLYVMMAVPQTVTVIKMYSLQ